MNFVRHIPRAMVYLSLVLLAIAFLLYTQQYTTVFIVSEENEHMQIERLNKHTRDSILLEKVNRVSFRDPETGELITKRPNHTPYIHYEDETRPLFPILDSEGNQKEIKGKFISGPAWSLSSP